MSRKSYRNAFCTDNSSQYSTIASASKDAATLNSQVVVKHQPFRQIATVVFGSWALPDYLQLKGFFNNLKNFSAGLGIVLSYRDIFKITYHIVN